MPLVPASARVICVGLNYKAHAAEGSYRDQDLPPYPTLFGRWTASLSVGNVPVPVPGGEDGLDWEGEVAAYIGRRVESADEAEAAEAVFGYSTFYDITARRAQKLTSQWTLVVLELDHHTGVFLSNDEPPPVHMHGVVRTPSGNDYGRELVKQHPSIAP
ncbi:fumarylacetoacetate hydrolase family protein [Pseudarthrobacter phenanthrenivorans]|uniref:fumarylacetoacetate hydrolase family protein n=1 Tax=Pseudarthrobacter phenanthrenivorans TaxID=361575 RepID=UPI001FEA73F6|nr:fumarylacetoacetate hydrolase family protein [Pseudarthrobacter phenanthrenivorans]